MSDKRWPNYEDMTALECLEDITRAAVFCMPAGTRAYAINDITMARAIQLTREVRKAHNLALGGMPEKGVRNADKEFDEFKQAGRAYHRFRRTWKYGDGDRATRKLDNLYDAFHRAADRFMAAELRLVMKEQRKK